jgi:hypothetical protein
MPVDFDMLIFHAPGQWISYADIGWTAVYQLLKVSEKIEECSFL